MCLWVPVIIGKMNPDRLCILNHYFPSHWNVSGGKISEDDVFGFDMCVCLERGTGCVCTFISVYMYVEAN